MASLAAAEVAVVLDRKLIGQNETRELRAFGETDCKFYQRKHLLVVVVLWPPQHFGEHAVSGSLASD